MATYYPPVSFHFKVEVKGIGKGDADMCFQQVSGLSSALGVEELPVGGENRFTYRLPTRARFENLILKRGMLLHSGLIDWFRDAIENFSFRPADVSVSLLNEKHQVSAAWEFIGAYPVKWAIADLKAQENAIAVETIELAYQYYRRSQ